MRTIDLVRKIVWKVYGDRKVLSKADNCADEFKIRRDINWNIVCDEVRYYPEPELIELPNSEHINTLLKDKEYIVNKQAEIVDRLVKLPGNVMHMQDGIHPNGYIMTERSAGEVIYSANKKLSEGELLSRAGNYLFGAKENVCVEIVAEKTCNFMNDILDDIEKDVAILSKGETGESRVNKALQIYEGKYKILENIVIPANDAMGKTSETDVYIITEKGIMVCEVKNYGNAKQKIHISADGKWTKVDAYSGKVLENIKSPVEQNTRHCLATERFLEKYFDEENNIKIIPIIIIANNDVAIENHSKSTVIRVSELYTIIDEITTYQLLDKTKRDEIANIFEKNKLDARGFNVKSRKNQADYLAEMERLIEPYVFYNSKIARFVQKMYVRTNIISLVTMLLIFAMGVASFLYIQFDTEVSIFFSMCLGFFMIATPLSGILITIISFLFCFLFNSTLAGMISVVGLGGYYLYNRNK